jgi:hypothetical protein
MGRSGRQGAIMQEALVAAVIAITAKQQHNGALRGPFYPRTNHSPATYFATIRSGLSLNWALMPRLLGS